MGALGHFGRRVPGVGSAVPRPAAWSRRCYRGISLGGRFIIGLRLVGHGSNALLPPNMVTVVVTARPMPRDARHLVRKPPESANYMILSVLCKSF